jgi:hypothetical protein
VAPERLPALADDAGPSKVEQFEGKFKMIRVSFFTLSGRGDATTGMGIGLI